MGHYTAGLSVFGWSIFFVAFVVAIILYANVRKFYPVMYLISIATYIFTSIFVVDAFDLGKNGMLVSLAISSVLFIGAGYYFSKKYKHKKEAFMNTIPDKKK